MIRFSRREDYSVILIHKLVQNYKRRIVPLSEIAKEYDISGLFLRNLAYELKKSGIIKAIEGKGGGYYLDKDPKDLKVGDVLGVFGPAQLFECCSYGTASHGKGKTCPKASFCDPGFVWRKLNKEFLDRIYNMSFSDFIKMREEKV